MLNVKQKGALNENSALFELGYDVHDQVLITCVNQSLLDDIPFNLVGGDSVFTH